MHLIQVKVILNETAVHALGWKNATDAIGQQIRIPETQQYLQ